MTNIEKAQQIIGQGSGNYVVADYTEFCRLYVQIGQDMIKSKKLYDTEKVYLDLRKETRVEDLCTSVDPDTKTEKNPHGKLYTKTRAETKARLEFQKEEISLLEMKLQLEQMRIFFSTMDRFASAIKMEVDVTFKDATLEPMEDKPPF